MSDCTEQANLLEILFPSRKTAKEAYEMLQKAFKEEALSHTQVFEWFVQFKRGEMSVLKIILILGARQQVVPTRMKKKFKKKSTRIVGTQLTRSQKLQV